MITSFTVQTPDGISWYCEREGDGPDLMLIPSGEGDCFSFRKTASILAQSYRVTTFDMPGMSRSTAPEACYQNVTAALLADQVASLMDQLGDVPVATFYGCSSGGAAVLALIANHPSRVQSGIVHEVPYSSLPALTRFPSMADSEIMETCERIFSTGFIEDGAAFHALGEEYHSRLKKNYVTWARNYVNHVESSLDDFTDEDLRNRPITWSLGALTPTGAFFDNVKVAHRLDIDLQLLPSKHFPQITIPEKLAEHIGEVTAKYL
jgi:pimeloyl-ACP methyl ester carboxylesterase